MGSHDRHRAIDYNYDLFRRYTRNVEQEQERTERELQDLNLHSPSEKLYLNVYSYVR